VAFLVAASVKLHGARPWHLGELCGVLCKRERETPRRKAVASKFEFSHTHSIVQPCGSCYGSRVSFGAYDLELSTIVLGGLSSFTGNLGDGASRTYSTRIIH